jgi:hypothetical protein
MARSRNVKPGLFKNEILGDADPIYSLLFVGLWTLADKEGRLEHRPKRIKAELFPYKPELDLSKALAWLNNESFITVYENDGSEYIQISNWKKHQSPHHKEVDSVIPAPQKAEKRNSKQQLAHACAKHDSSMIQACSNEIASSPLIPDSLNLIPDSLNLIPDKSNMPGKPGIPAKKKWTEEDQKCADKMLEAIRAMAPSAKQNSKWPDAIRLMREQDKRTHIDIMDMFTWANKDTFWSSNILSPSKLREKWVTLEGQRNRGLTASKPENKGVAASFADKVYTSTPIHELDWMND